MHTWITSRVLLSSSIITINFVLPLLLFAISVISITFPFLLEWVLSNFPYSSGKYLKVLCSHLVHVTDPINTSFFSMTTSQKPPSPPPCLAPWQSTFHIRITVPSSFSDRHCYCLSKASHTSSSLEIYVLSNLLHFTYSCHDCHVLSVIN